MRWPSHRGGAANAFGAMERYRRQPVRLCKNALKCLDGKLSPVCRGPGYWLCCTVQPVGMPLLPEGQVTSFFLMKVPPEGTPLTQFISASLAEMSLAVQVIFLREVQLLNIME